MIIRETALAKVAVIETQPFVDERGSFARWFCRNELSTVLGDFSIVQINQSITRKAGTIRGMHFQRPPFAEMKLVRCLKGQVFDVALDLRAGSKTFGHWHAELLTPENARMLVIPEGCAHGFQALTDDVELLYLHTAPYQPDYEAGALFNDPAFAIQWPLACVEISEKDARYASIMDDFRGITV